MIKNIKIFGERNSGTNFLSQLIKKNVKNIKLFGGCYLNITGWKHGFPRLNLFNNIDEVLFIFIIRDLESWLISMYNNPYSYESPPTIEEFVSKDLIINDKRKNHDVNINKDERQNVIRLRYSKFRSYMKVFEQVPNAMFINLKDLQDNNDKFLRFLKLNYQLKIEEATVKVQKHTKVPGSTICNRTYSTVLPVIYLKDNEIENTVRRLKDKYHFKSNTG